MATSGDRLSLARKLFSLATIGLALATSPYATEASGEARYQTIDANGAAAALASAIKIGETGGNTYYVKIAAPGIAQIIKVNSEDIRNKAATVRFSGVGTIMNGKPLISDTDEQKQFEQVMDNMTVGQAKAIGLSASSSVQPPGTGSAQAAVNQQPQQTAIAPTGKIDGTVARNGDAIDVRFGDKVVEFQNNGSHVIDKTTSGARVGELQYVGVANGTPAGEKAKGGLRVLGNAALSGITLGHDGQTSVNPNSTTITTVGPGGREFSINSDNLGNGKGPVISANSGVVFDAIVASDLVKAQLDPKFKMPNEDNLRKLVDATAASVKTPSN
ncbi:hypothetical protein [Acidicapsa acidisoli]|uniref:hypothetical protein n=1 Tax=Acidicapsa acidisoli TaxID=1615681 RepID=UPI0021E0D12C|nr:hypothetical protein [Acidicapsa acidisoli]